MTDRARPLTLGRVAAFWAPLAATWFMMSVEGPFIAAVVARLSDPTINLAAYGVAFSFAWINEAPVIMLMSTATALARDRDAFLRLRRFTYTLNVLVTAGMVVFLLPPVFTFAAEGLIGLPHEVARLTHVATLLLLPWPAAIGYRRFYQGVMIRHHAPRRVAYGTVVRVTSMAVTALLVRLVPGVPGACVGAAALSAGVVMEAVASRLMAAEVVGQVLAAPPSSAGARLSVGDILRFYYPLALTSVLALAVNPLVTFFLGRSRMAIESLAVFPVVASLAFLFRSGAMAYQEVCIALVGDRREHLPVLGRGAVLFALTASGALTLVAYTPLARLWFARVSGLAPDLTAVAVLPLRLLCLWPALDALMSLERALLVVARRTIVATWATIVEVSTLAAVLWLLIGPLDVVGVVAAAAAVIIGRTVAATFLVGPAFRMPAGHPR